jgi:hypothetical protein
MNVKIEKIEIHNITRQEAEGIRNELKLLAGGDVLVFNADKYPNLLLLDRLLAGCFDNMVNGVHMISKH